MAPDRAKSRVVAAGGSNTGDANKIAGTMEHIFFCIQPLQTSPCQGRLQDFPPDKGD